MTAARVTIERPVSSFGSKPTTFGFFQNSRIDKFFARQLSELTMDDAQNNAVSRALDDERSSFARTH